MIWPNNIWFPQYTNHTSGNRWINIINQPIFPWQHRWLWVLININTHYFGNMGIVLLHHTITLIPWNNIIIVFFLIYFCWVMFILLMIYTHHIPTPKIWWDHHGSKPPQDAAETPGATHRQVQDAEKCRPSDGDGYWAVIASLDPRINSRKKSWFEVKPLSFIINFYLMIPYNDL